MLHPNNKQKTKMFKYAHAARFAYNWAIEQEKKAYENGQKFIAAYDLHHALVKFKKEEGNEWLCEANSEAMEKSITSAVKAYKRFFDGVSNYPKFKSRKKSKLSFYQPTKKIKVTSSHVSIQGLAGTIRRSRLQLNFVKLAKKNAIPLGVDYHNPRISYDGINWWFSVSIEESKEIEAPMTEGLGIDLGLKDLAIISNATVYPNINKTEIVRKIKKKLHRTQRQISRKYLMNKEGERFKKTKNIIKAEREALKLNHRLSNIRNNYIHHITSEIAITKPEYIVMEDLNVRGMMKNKHVSRAIAEQAWGEFYRQMQYKSEWNGIKFIVADKWFPSSKLCSACGIVNKELKWSDRVFVCPYCGHTTDRDMQAAVNLSRYVA